MEITRISVTKKQVQIDYTDVDKHGGTRETTFKSREQRPLPTFSDVIAGFLPYVTGLLDLPAAWNKTLTVTTLNLSRSTDGRRGLMVSVVRPVAKAQGRVVSITTPLVHEAGETESNAEAFVLTDEVMDLVAMAEVEAEAFLKGERAQLELLPTDATAAAETSANAKEFAERAASASIASTRKAKSRANGAVNGAAPATGKAFVPGVGDVMNPSATEKPSDEQLQRLCASFGKDVGLDAINLWTSTERDQVVRYAQAVANDERATMPLCVQRAASPKLFDTDHGVAARTPPTVQ